MNVEGVKATFREGNRLASQGKETLTRAADQAAEAAVLVHHTLHDSRHEDAEAVVEKLKVVADEIEITMRRFDSAIRNIDQYLKTLG